MLAPINDQDTKEITDGGDPELMDDSEFYQQLLKEFLETFDPTSSGKSENHPSFCTTCIRVEYSLPYNKKVLGIRIFI